MYVNIISGSQKQIQILEGAIHDSLPMLSKKNEKIIDLMLKIIL
jgi:hypothetical protein